MEKAFEACVRAVAGPLAPGSVQIENALEGWTFLAAGAALEDSVQMEKAFEGGGEEGAFSRFMVDVWFSGRPISEVAGANCYTTLLKRCKFRLNGGYKFFRLESCQRMVVMILVRTYGQGWCDHIRMLRQVWRGNRWRHVAAWKFPSALQVY